MYTVFTLGRDATVAEQGDFESVTEAIHAIWTRIKGFAGYCIVDNANSKILASSGAFKNDMIG